MKKLSLLLLTATLLIVLELNSQTLTNGLEMKDVYIEMENGKRIESHSAGEMVLAYNTTTIRLYQDDQFTYWAEFKFRQCGKKAKLTSKTYLELKNGEIINGASLTSSKKIDKGQADWLVGVYDDAFNMKGDDKALKAGFSYAMRFTN